MCPGEVTLRFHTSVCLGLSHGEHQRACAQHEANELRGSLPEISPGLVTTASIIRSFRPAVLAVGVIAGSQVGKVHARPAVAGALVLSVVCLSGGNTLDRFLAAFTRLRTHVENCRRHACKSMVLTTRCGTQSYLPYSALVPGDVIQLRPGLCLPADTRILSSFGLYVDNSFLPHCSATISALLQLKVLGCMQALTGWHRRGVKCSSDADEEDSAMLDAKCVAIGSSLVTRGSALAVITRTGENSAVFRLLMHLSKISVLEVLLLPWRF